MHSDHVVWSDESPSGDLVLGIVSRRAYRISGGALVHAADIPWVPRADDLLGMFRETTDVILDGSAHSVRGPVTRLTTQLAVGSLHKRVDVFGDRELVVATDGALSETSPTSFTSMPLTRDRAYGGRDIEAEDLVQRTGIEAHGILAYARNVEGCGYFYDVDRQRLNGARLPNLSDPDDPVTVDRILTSEIGDWLDRPTPATYTAIDGSVFPRLIHNKIGIFTSKRARPIREVQLGAMSADDLEVNSEDPRDVRACNAATPGLGTTRLAGNEKVSLWNLHREHEHLELNLPGETPRMIIEPPNTKPFELEAKLATVHIEPDEDRITLIWAGSMQVAGVYPLQMCTDMRRAVIWN